MNTLAKVFVDAKVKGKRVARKTATVDGTGRYKAVIALKRKGTARFTARFAGSDQVSAIASRAVTVKAG